jgi:hypothetical protein
MSFNGFVPPVRNFYAMPNNWTDISSEIDNLAELKVVEYVLRHTWGFHEYGICKVISIDEFMHGRRRVDGSRMDLGTGLKSDRSVKDAIKLAILHGYLVCQVDNSDRGRTKKSYALKMSPPDEAGGCNLPPVDTTPPPQTGVANDTQGGSIYPSEVQHLPLRGATSTHRSEKDTIERHYRKTLKKNTRESASATASSDAGFISPSSDKNEKKDDEITPEQKERAAALKAVIVAKRGYDLDERGPSINESRCIARLVQEYMDEDLIDTLTYLHERHYKWSKPDNKYTIGAQILRNEIRGVLMEFQADPALRKPPKQQGSSRSTTPTTARADPPSGSLPKTVMSEEQARILTIQAVEQAASKQHTITAEAVALEDGRWVIRVDWQTPPFTKPAIISSETRWSQLFLDICDIWKKNERKEALYA